MDGFDDEWDNEQFLAELFRVQDEAVASLNPNPTPASATAPAPPDPVASAVTSHLPPPATASYRSSSSSFVLPLSNITAAPHVSAPVPPSASVSFSPPRELSQHPLGPDIGRGFSPPRELSQRPAAEESGREIIAAAGPAGGDRFGCGGVRRERDSCDADRREIERLKRELNRVSKQMNEMKNECSELKKYRARKDLDIKAKEAEIQSLKRANVGCASKDVGGVVRDIGQSIHAPANGALHAGGSCWASTRRTEKLNGKHKELSSPQYGFSSNQGNQTDASEDLELKHGVMVDNRTSATEKVNLEESAHFESKGSKWKDIKTIGVQTDLPWNTDHLDEKNVLVSRISSNLCAVWGMPTNGLSGRNLISKILVSCLEEILALLQSTESLDKCETTPDLSSNIRNAISQVYDIITKMNNDTVPIQTLIDALLNLAAVGNAAVVGKALRMLHSALQHLLSYRTKSDQRNNVFIEPCVHNTIHMERNSHKGSFILVNTPDAENLSRSHDEHAGIMQLPFSFWTSLFTAVLQIGIRHSEESIRVDALSIMILIARTSDPKGEREKFGFTSIIENLHQLLQKGNGLLVKKHSVDLLFLLLNCPATLKLLCSGGKDNPEQIEAALGCENDRSRQAISSIFKDLSECLNCKATSNLEIKLCRVVVTLLAYIASSGKLGYEVLLGPVTVRGASFLELITEVLASQMEYEVDHSNGGHELLKERYLLMREVLILLNRLASHANFSKPTLEVLTSSKLCATLTIDITNRLPQKSKYPLRNLGEINAQMANDLAELAQKFCTRVHSFLEEQNSTVDHSNPSALHRGLQPL